MIVLIHVWISNFQTLVVYIQIASFVRTPPTVGVRQSSLAGSDLCVNVLAASSRSDVLSGAPDLCSLDSAS